MKMLVDIQHPASVHFFKNMIWNLENHGHDIKITAKDKEITLKLLDAYGFNYEILAKSRKNLVNKALGMFEIDWKLFNIAKKVKADILTGVHNESIAHVSWFIRKPSVIFTDTEHARIGNMLTFPFASAICTPSCFKKNLGTKQVQYNGYHELAYLHPNYFKPNSSVLDDLGLSKTDRFVILRFVSWEASHDVGQHGIDLEAKQKYIKELEKFGKVFITSEVRVRKKFDKYKIKVPPEKIHDLLFYATLYIGEGATMATEAGILGTPSIYVSSLVGTMGNFEELEKRYGLIYSFRDPSMALEKALQFLDDESSKALWQKKRGKLLDEKIDVTKFMTEFIENYPESFINQKQVLK